MTTLTLTQFQKTILDQLDAALAHWDTFRTRIDARGPGDSDEYDSQIVNSGIRLALESICPPGHPLRKDMEVTLSSRLNDYDTTAKIAAIGKTLRDAIHRNTLTTFGQVVHREMFDDFLTMADHLLSEGYKDAAAVIAGTSLESHLRQLCIQNGVSITITKQEKLINKTAGPMNNDLRSASVYDATQQKLNSAYIDIRNHAAHGNYSKYSDQDIKTMLMAVRTFLNQYPA